MTRLAATFKERHGAVLGVMNIIGRLTRKVAMLSDDEIDELEHATKQLEAVWITSYPDHPLLPPKLHVIIDHIPKFARYFGSLGVFGEDGIEALHPMHSRVRALVKSMRNPRERGEAEQKHMIISQKF